MKKNSKSLICLSVFFLILFFALSCGKEDAKQIASNFNIDDLKKLNTITDEARADIQNKLDAAINNLNNNLISLGVSKINENPVIFFIGSSDKGVSISSNTNIKIEAEINNVYTELAKNDYQIKGINDIPTPSISLSSVMDYSGSMRNQDIDDAVEIYKDIYKILNPVFENEIRLFSKDVVRKLDFTTNYDTMSAYIVRDKQFKRGFTALYDGIGAGLTALKNRNTPIRILIVSTDGGENASKIFTDKSQLYTLAKNNNIHVIILGSLFADLNFMKELSKETNGFYVYNRALIGLKNDMTSLLSMFSNIQAVEITNSSLNKVSKFKITIDNKSIISTF